MKNSSCKFTFADSPNGLKYYFFKKGKIRGVVIIYWKRVNLLSAIFRFILEEK